MAVGPEDGGEAQQQAQREGDRDLVTEVEDESEKYGRDHADDHRVHERGHDAIELDPCLGVDEFGRRDHRHEQEGLPDRVPAEISSIAARRAVEREKDREVAVAHDRPGHLQLSLEIHRLDMPGCGQQVQPQDQAEEGSRCAPPCHSGWIIGPPRQRVESRMFERPSRWGRAGEAAAWARARSAVGGRFVAVGLAGLGVNQLLLLLGVERGHLNYLLGAGIASQGSTLFNFIATDAWVFRGRRTTWGALRRYVAYDALNTATLVVRLPALFLMVQGIHLHYLLANVLVLGSLTLLRFATADRFIWAGEVVAGGTTGAEEVLALRRRRHHYNIDGLLAIDSAVALPELAFFRSEPADDPGLVVEIAPMGGWRLRGRATMHGDGDQVTYREHLGGLFTNFRIEMGPPVRVTAGPLLAFSPHVLYTNVIEVLVRFLLVRRGRVLVHAASMRLDGEGILLSARTDSGKTTATLQLLGERSGAFLSDDMTILDSEGYASRYPKPLTISAHTLRAVPQHQLDRRRRLALWVQSRVHSRTGREFGKRLARSNLPIMSMNALVQIAVPPPKYEVTALVSCEIDQKTKMSRLYLVERGTPAGVAPMGRAEAVAELLENTEDAYGFPPYAELAPLLEIDGLGYEELRRAERRVVASALRSMVVTRVRDEGFGWAEHIAPTAADGAAAAG